MVEELATSSAGRSTLVVDFFCICQIIKSPWNRKPFGSAF